MTEASMKDIFVAGAGGGIAYWAYTLYRGTQPAADVARFPPETWLWISLLLVVILGAAAAFMMVYFVAATNTKERLRAVGFAAACGLCWEPVLAGITDRFTREYVDRDAANAVTQAQALSTLDSEQAATVAATLVSTAPAVQNPVLRENVRAETERLLQQIEATPDLFARTEALQAVGEAAAEAGESEVLTRTIRSLEAVADLQPRHESRAQEAISAIGAKSVSVRRRPEP